MLREYFLYRHIRNDKNEPFYIGIGVKHANYASEKVEFKRAFEKTNRNKYWKNIVQKTNYKVDILFESNDENVIKGKEKEFIELYKRRDCCGGTLVNMTDGGDGSFGRKWSDEFRVSFIEKNSGQNHYNYGKKLSEETIKKKSESMKKSNKGWRGKNLPKETVEKIRQSKIGNKNPMYGKISPLAKKLIDIDTLETFNSFKEASNSCKYSFQYISENVNRENNYTPFVLYNTYLEKGLDYCRTVCNKEKKIKIQGVKKVKNTHTGEIFNSLKEASKSIGMDEHKFRYAFRNNKINFEKIN